MLTETDQACKHPRTLKHHAPIDYIDYISLKELKLFDKVHIFSQKYKEVFW